MSSTPAPSSTPSHLALRPATRADLPALANTIAASFYDFELYDHFLPHRRAQYQEFYRFLLVRLRGLYAESEARFTIAEGDAETLAPMLNKQRLHSDGTVPTEPAVTSTGKTVVAFAVWEAMGNGSNFLKEWQGQGYDASAGGRGWSMLPSAISAFAEGYLVECERRYVKYFLNTICDHQVLRHLITLLHGSFTGMKETLHLQFLVTHPCFQGTGAGGALLDWGLDVARERNIPVVLESSLQGWRFYEKRGFKVVKMARIEAGEMQKRKGTQSYDMPVMIWEPEGHEGGWTESNGSGGWRLKTGVGEVHVSEEVGQVEA